MAMQAILDLDGVMATYGMASYSWIMHKDIFSG